MEEARPLASLLTICVDFEIYWQENAPVICRVQVH